MSEHTPDFVPAEAASSGAGRSTASSPWRAQRYVRLALTRTTARTWQLITGAAAMLTRYGPGVSIPTDNGAEIEALAGSNPNFAAWKQNKPYTIALLIKGRSGGASTRHLYRSGTSSAGDHILWLSCGTTPNLRHEASGGGTVSITSSVAIVNDATWSTIVGTWRPGHLELFVDGWSRASSTTAATSTSAMFGIYRWGWGFSTSQDFNGDIAPIACFASSCTSAMVRRWHADSFGFLRPWNELPALMGSAPPATPPSTGTGVVTFLMGIVAWPLVSAKLSRDRLQDVHQDLARVVERAIPDPDSAPPGSGRPAHA